jgi:hypothetical protein
MNCDGGNENWGCKNAFKFLPSLGTHSFIITVLLGVTSVDVTLSVTVFYSCEKFFKNLGTISNSTDRKWGTKLRN